MKILMILLLDFFLIWPKWKLIENIFLLKWQDLEKTKIRNARLGEEQARIKIARRNINNLRFVDDTTLMEESEEDLKNLLMKVKEESEKLA